jgi:hypothetical protein
MIIFSSYLTLETVSLNLLSVKYIEGDSNILLTEISCLGSDIHVIL